LDVDEGIVEQAKFIGIHIIRKVELNHMSARMLNWTFLIKVQHRGTGVTLQTNEPPGEFHEVLTEFLGLFGEPTFANSQNGSQADFEIKTDPNGKIPVRSAYLIAPRDNTKHQRQIYQAICSCWIQPSQGNFGSLVLFLAKPDGMLRMGIDYCAVNSITVRDHYPHPHIENIFNSKHGSCVFTQLDLAAAYLQICIATDNR
jgi:putative transposase